MPLAFGGAAQGHLNRVIKVHPLINVVKVRGGAGQGP